jgi:heme-degrading monooxygenase HmoA
MLARVARYEVPAERLDDAVAAFAEASAQIEQLDGFSGGYLFVDREDGRTMTLTLWDNIGALEASERTARNARREASEAVGGAVLSVESFEVARELTPQTASS